MLRQSILQPLCLMVVIANAALGDSPGFYGQVFERDQRHTLKGAVANAKIQFKTLDGSVAAETKTDQHGRYRAQLKPGEYQFVVAAPGFKDENEGRRMILVSSGRLAQLNFALTRGKSDKSKAPPTEDSFQVGDLAGTVVERKPDGTLVGIPNAVVSLLNESTRKVTKVEATEKNLDNQQRGEFYRLLETGSWRASVSAPGFDQLKVAAPIRIEQGQIVKREFVLERIEAKQIAKKQGLVVDVHLGANPDESADPPKVELHVLRSHIAPNQHHTTKYVLDPSEPLRIELPVGEYWLSAKAHGYNSRNRSKPVQVVPAKFTRVSLALEKAPQLRPQLKMLVLKTIDGKNQKRLPGAKLLIRSAGSAASMSKHVANSKGEVQITLPENTKAGDAFQVLAHLADTENGNRALKGSALVTLEGDRTVKAVRLYEIPAKKSASALTPGVAVKPSTQAQKRPLTLTVSVTGVTTQNRTSTTTPLDDAIVELRGPHTIRRSTDSAGRVFFLPKKPGRYTVTVTHTKFRSQTESVDISSGDKTIDVKVQRKIERFKWTLKVNESNRRGTSRGLPLHKATIHLKIGDDVIQKQTSEAGLASYSLLPGRYEFAVSHPQFKAKQKIIQIDGPKSTSVTLTRSQRPLVPNLTQSRQRPAQAGPVQKRSQPRRQTRSLLPSRSVSQAQQLSQPRIRTTQYATLSLRAVIQFTNRRGQFRPAQGTLVAVPGSRPMEVKQDGRINLRVPIGQPQLVAFRYAGRTLQRTFTIYQNRHFDVPVGQATLPLPQPQRQQFVRRMPYIHPRQQSPQPVKIAVQLYHPGKRRYLPAIGNGIRLEVVQNGRVIRTLPVNSAGTAQVQLAPGHYTIRASSFNGAGMRNIAVSNRPVGVTIVLKQQNSGPARIEQRPIPQLRQPLPTNTPKAVRPSTPPKRKWGHIHIK